MEDCRQDQGQIHDPGESLRFVFEGYSAKLQKPPCRQHIAAADQKSAHGLKGIGGEFLKKSHISMAAVSEHHAVQIIKQFICRHIAEQISQIERTACQADRGKGESVFFSILFPFP